MYERVGIKKKEMDREGCNKHSIVVSLLLQKTIPLERVVRLIQKDRDTVVLDNRERERVNK